MSNVYSKVLYFPCKEMESIIVDREKRHLPIHGKNKRMCKFSSFLLLFNINTGPIICQEQSDMLKAKWKGREIISCYWTYPFVSKRVVLITRYILFDTLNESKDDDCWMVFNHIVSYNKTYPLCVSIICKYQTNSIISKLVATNHDTLLNKTIW